jgi:uroporphyrin-III C-methyltransferase/precorrin-2 dehydrogenase/sirohydrochlorin ferrochelatase
MSATARDRRRPALVSLVGAGPGDPDLLTRAAAKRLRQADLVLYDALVPAPLVQLARHAQCFCVGKRAGRASVRQETINLLMIRGARRGQRVVRLKCGDPFVLGRGGEEALALRNAGVPFEVVPGVSSAIAAPALAGIPVTHRGMASAFVVLSAHEESAYGPLVDGLPPNSLTIVALMGIGGASRLAARLLARGWRSRTPAALLFAASTPHATTWRGTLAELASRGELSSEAPGTIVIGEVVSLAGALTEVVDTALRSAGAQVAEKAGNLK